MKNAWMVIAVAGALGCQHPQARTTVSPRAIESAANSGYVGDTPKADIVGEFTGDWGAISLVVSSGTSELSARAFAAHRP